MYDTSHPGRGITVTIAYGQGEHDTRATFHGSVEQVREDVIGFFGLDGASGIGLNPSELILNATQLAHGIGTLAHGLGATAIPAAVAAPQSPAPATAAAPRSAVVAQSRSADDPWGMAASNTAPLWPDSTPPAAPPSAAPAAAVRHPLVEVIERAVDLDGLKRLWAENQAAFTDPEVMAAWKARGRTLSSGTA